MNNDILTMDAIAALEHPPSRPACAEGRAEGHPLDTPSKESGAPSPDWRAGEILRLTALVSELHRQLAERSASQQELRKINSEYAARVGFIEHYEEAARSRAVELAEVRQEAAVQAGIAASLQRSQAERDEREAAMRDVLRDRDALIDELQAGGAQLSSAFEALEKDLSVEPASSAAAMAAVAAAADSLMMSQANAAAADALRTLEAKLEALHAELRDSVARADALRQERDGLRGWHDAVTATMRWRLVGRPGGTLPPRPGTADAS